MLQSNRSIGVKIPEGQLRERSDKPDLTVEHMLSVEFFAIQYVDKGRVKQGLVCVSGGVFYLAPSGDQWLAGMKPLSDRMAANVKNIYNTLKGAAVAEVPDKDTVDVIAGDMVSRAAGT